MIPVFNKPLPGAQVDWTHRSAQGMVLCCLFNEGAGEQTADVSRYNQHCTLNWPGVPVAWEGGVAGRCVDFWGINRSGDFGAIRSATNVTVSAIVNLRDTSVSSPMIVSSKPGANETELRFSASTTQPDFIYNTTNVTSTEALNTGEWYHLVGTADANTVTVYVDGQAKASAATGSTREHTSWRIGMREAAAFPFAGKIADVRIFDRAMPADEVKRFYADPYGMFF